MDCFRLIDNQTILVFIIIRYDSFLKLSKDIEDVKYNLAEADKKVAEIERKLNR